MGLKEAEMQAILYWKVTSTEQNSSISYQAERIRAWTICVVFDPTRSVSVSNLIIPSSSLQEEAFAGEMDHNQVKYELSEYQIKQSVL